MIWRHWNGYTDGKAGHRRCIMKMKLELIRAEAWSATLEDRVGGAAILDASVLS
jgi:hypothetical protein